MLVGLDFETYGSVDLPTHGLDRYINDPTFMPLIGAMHYETPGRALVREYDFVFEFANAKAQLKRDVQENMIAAHNATFEVAVLDWLDIPVGKDQIVDTAVVSRINGGESKLEHAAPQLLGIDKMHEGRDLIRLFSIPGKYQEKNGNSVFDPRVILDNPEKWELFKQYCRVDAKLCYQLARNYPLSEREQDYQWITMVMSQRGWPVDVKIVEEMYRRFLENLNKAEVDFHTRYGELNFNSLKQMKEFCAERGVKATSFDQKHVESMLKKIDAKIETIPEGGDKWHDYFEVQYMLNTKQILGGSSLKKLKVILDTVGSDGRLRDQYVHCGAGQSRRTTGRAAQMQNLPRLGDKKLDDMLDLLRDDLEFDNDTLAENIRQCFTASDPSGSLIVGDFKSVESRGLAWLAGEEWKLKAYREGRGVYEELAAKFNNTRTFGKVGELSCGYQAGPGAVKDFAAGMGVVLTDGEATKLVYDWRDSCPKTVKFWEDLDVMLRSVVTGTPRLTHQLADGFTLELSVTKTPPSLLNQAGALRSVKVRVLDSQQNNFLERVFLGTHMRGSNIVYFKPTAKKSGDLWTHEWMNPKTKQMQDHTIYGGKLAGILTQSFCRELFFQCLLKVHNWVRVTNGVELIGQFHDEIVLDYTPLPHGAAQGSIGTHGGMTRVMVIRHLKALMSDPGLAKSFPLEADVKHDYRYTK